MDHAIYFTVVGGRSPRWLFVNCKSMINYQWVTALMTAYSVQLSNGIPVDKVIQQMKETFSPGGSCPIPGTSRMAPSIVYMLGLLLERHCNG